MNDLSPSAATFGDVLRLVLPHARPVIEAADDPIAFAILIGALALEECVGASPTDTPETVAERLVAELYRRGPARIERN